MTQRRLLRWSLILAIFAAFAVWLEPTRVVWGWLRGKAFHEGWWRLIAASNAIRYDGVAEEIAP